MRRMTLLLGWAVLPLSFGMAASSQEEVQRSGAIPGVISSGSSVELVKDGYSFTEGPVGTADGGLYFTDSRPTRIYRLDPTGRIVVFRENGGDADGLALDAAGMLFSADRINNTGISR